MIDMPIDFHIELVGPLNFQPSLAWTEDEKRWHGSCKGNLPWSLDVWNGRGAKVLEAWCSCSFPFLGNIILEPFLVMLLGHVA